MKNKFVKIFFFILIAGSVFLIADYQHSKVKFCEQLDYRERKFTDMIKGDLHNLLLACKSYWADKGRESKCNLDIAKGENYGFNPDPSGQLSGCYPSYPKNIRASGTEKEFKASAWFEKKAEVKKKFVGFEINSKGEFRKLSMPPS